jgi:CRP-like cAMP-binding protein
VATVSTPKSTFKVWAVDEVVYGPVEIPTLTQWVKEERIRRSSWIYSVAADKWCKAADLPELSATFPPLASSTPAAGKKAPTLADSLQPGSLRRVKLFAELTDSQLARFVEMVEVVQVAKLGEVVRKDTQGDALFAILEGELRARLIVGGRETTLATYSPGEFFGEMTLFDESPRAADVVATVDSKLLKISRERFRIVCESQPDLATLFLLALGRALTSRVRNDNRKITDLMTIARGTK